MNRVKHAWANGAGTQAQNAAPGTLGGIGFGPAADMLVSAGARLATTAGRAVLGGLALALAVGAAPASAQTYPSKTVRLVVPYPAGGGTDTLGRVLAKELSTITGASVIVDNKGGADGTLGTDMVAKAPADGYTLLVVPGATFALNQVTFNKLPYDVLEDFEPISAFASGPMVLLAHPSVPAQSMAEFVQLIKANPGKYTYAGSDPFTYLTTEMILRSVGATMTHVPYKGAAPALNELLGGHVHVLISSLAPALGHIHSNKLKALAVTSKNRPANLPNVPTIAETVAPGFDVSTWFGVMAPKGTPKSVIAFLNDAIGKAVESPEVKKSLAALGTDAMKTTPEQSAVLLRTQLTRLREAAKETNLAPK